MVASAGYNNPSHLCSGSPLTTCYLAFFGWLLACCLPQPLGFVNDLSGHVTDGRRYNNSFKPMPLRGAA